MGQVTKEFAADASLPSIGLLISINSSSGTKIYPEAGRSTAVSFGSKLSLLRDAIDGGVLSLRRTKPKTSSTADGTHGVQVADSCEVDFVNNSGRWYNTFAQ
jgi:hypothetical protein